MSVFTDITVLQSELTNNNYNNASLLLMTSGDFNGMDVVQLANNLISE